MADDIDLSVDLPIYSLSDKHKETIREIGFKCGADRIILALELWNAGYSSGVAAQAIGCSQNAWGMYMTHLIGRVPVRTSLSKRAYRVKDRTEIDYLRAEILYLSKHADMNPAARQSLNRAKRWLANLLAKELENQEANPKRKVYGTPSRI